MTRYLYRKAMQAVTLMAAIGCISFSMQAQFRVPPPERKTPRAIGVLETYKNGSRRLVPITFYYEKHYYDATFYHATPVPFTLYSETVYEVQQFGKALGTFTIQSATQNSAEWFGNGRFKVAPDPALMAKKAAVAPVVIDDPSRPVLHRHEGSEGDFTPAHPSAAATASTNESDSDPDRPKLHRREGSESETAKTDTASGQAGTGQAGTGQAAGTTSGTAKAGSAPSGGTQAGAGQTEESSGQDPNRPKLQRRDGSGDAKNGGGSTASTAPATTASDKGAGDKSAGSISNNAGAPFVVAKAELTPSSDPDHPVLRRGKPVQEQGGRDLPDFKKEEPVSRMIAVSDAGKSELEPLLYVCREEERKQIEASVRELAESELRRLAVQRGIVLPGSDVSATQAKKTVAGKKVAAKGQTAVAPIPLTDEQFIPYDLDYNNYATVVYSARYVAPMATGAGTKSKSWVVTVVARQDEGKLIKLYSAVSDPRELDLYPEVRLVDAVDPDGYGRMALLFREKKLDGVSWLLGRPTGYELQTVFETPSR